MAGLHPLVANFNAGAETGREMRKFYDEGQAADARSAYAQTLAQQPEMGAIPEAPINPDEFGGEAPPGRAPTTGQPGAQGRYPGVADWAQYRHSVRQAAAKVGPEQVALVDQFVDSLQHKGFTTNLTRAAMLMQQGDAASAAKYLERGYSFMADGNLGTFTPLPNGNVAVMAYDEKTGKLAEKLVLTPESLGQSLEMFKDPGDFWKYSNDKKWEKEKWGKEFDLKKFEARSKADYQTARGSAAMDKAGKTGAGTAAYEKDPQTWISNQQAKIETLAKGDRDALLNSGGDVAPVENRVALAKEIVDSTGARGITGDTAWRMAGDDEPGSWTPLWKDEKKEGPPVAFTHRNFPGSKNVVMATPKLLRLYQQGQGQAKPAAAPASQGAIPAPAPGPRFVPSPEDIGRQPGPAGRVEGNAAKPQMNRFITDPDAVKGLDPFKKSQGTM